MGSGYYLSDGTTDLDAVFEPESGGNGASAPGYVRQDNGATLRYAAVSNGSPIASNTGYTLADGTTDFRSVWAAKGSVANLVSSLAFNGSTYDATCESVSWDDLLYSDIAVNLNADGTGSIVMMSTNYSQDNVSAYLASGIDNAPNGKTLSTFNWSSNPHAGVGSNFRCYVTPTLEEIGWIDWPTVGGAGVRYPAPWSDVVTQTNTDSATGRVYHIQEFSYNAAGMRGPSGIYCSGMGVYKNVSSSFTGMYLYGSDYTDPQSLGSNVKVGSQFQCVGNSGSVNYQDNNGGLSWYFRVNYTVKIESNDASHSVTGTFSVIHELRWQATNYTGGGGGGGFGGGCVAVDSVMYDGSRALQWGVHDALFITEPYGDAGAPNSTYGNIRVAETEWQPCFEIQTQSGARLRCSSTAPIPTKDDGYRVPAELMGKHVPMTTREVLDKAQAMEAMQVDFSWDEVVSVLDIGMQLVRKIFIDNRCFWASMDGELFILHHNLKPVMA